MLSIFFVPALANALEFSEHQNNSPSLLAILGIGEIENGDADKLDKILRKFPKKKNTVIYLKSKGGSLHEGMRLGRYFQKHRIKTVVEGNSVCASACALAFLGGTDITGSSWRSSSDNSLLGFHAFSARTKNLDTDLVQKIVAEILAYGLQVNAPIEILIVNFATPSESIYWLSNQDVCKLGIRLWSNISNSFIC